jgi:integrase
MASDLYAALIDQRNLNLTKDQVSQFHLLEKTLANSASVVAEALRIGDGDTWTQSDMRAFESELLKEVRGSREVHCVFNTLAKIVAQYQALYPTIDCPFPRSIHRVRLENNPFHTDLAASERLISRISAVVTEAAGTLHSGPTGDANSGSVKRAVIFGVLSSIVDFQLLHRSMLIALIETLADRKKSLLWGADEKCYAWSLSLAWKGEEDAERRMFVPRDLTGTFLAYGSERDIRKIFAEGLDQKKALAMRHKAIWEVLEGASREILRSAGFDRKVTLKSILKAACSAAYLRMPAALAAARCRKTVSHAPRNEVLRRIFKMSPIRRDHNSPAEKGRLESEIRGVEKEVNDITEVEPTWLEAMRSAFKLGDRAKVNRALSRICEQASQPGACLAGFSLSLLAEKKRSVGSTKRYSLLIARRCGCRLGDADPSTLTIEQLEDLYREALDDDWDQDPAGVKAQTVQRNKRATISAIVMFHKYLVKHAGVAPLDELAYLQKPRGLLPVDANFITVDEYLRVLSEISGPRGPADDYLRTVLRLIVILAFRCGLRRCEVLYLMAHDFDDADHLHVRNNKFRRVKTSNANRSIPAGILLSPEELSELNVFLREKRNWGNEALLFSKSEPEEMDVPLNPDGLVDKIHMAMRDALDDQSLKMHHLRHSFATLLTAKLLPNTAGFVRGFFGERHEKTVKWLEEDRGVFRKQLFGTSEIKGLDFQAVAHLLGHGSPATSVEHYIHSLDWFEPAEAP